MRARTTVVVPVAVLLALLAAGSARADRGVAINLGVIELTKPITPGRSYWLPTLRVRNPGDVRTSYRMVASPVQSDKRRSVPKGWFAFAPKTVTLKPGQRKRVSVRLVVPDDAEPGDYITLAGAQIVTEGGGAQVGAAAAARTTFTVARREPNASLWERLKAFFDDHAPWSYLVFALLLGGLVLRLLTRRFALRVERRDHVATER